MYLFFQANPILVRLLSVLNTSACPLLFSPNIAAPGTYEPLCQSKQKIINSSCPFTDKLLIFCCNICLVLCEELHWANVTFLILFTSPVLALLCFHIQFLILAKMRTYYHCLHFLPNLSAAYTLRLVSFAAVCVACHT